MSGNMVEALRLLPLKDWDAFFNERVLIKAMQIEACPVEKLAALKAEISQIREMQGIFVQQWNRFAEK